MLLPLFLGSSADAEKVAVVLSSSDKLYRDAMQGFQRAAKFEFRTFDLQGDVAQAATVLTGLQTEPFAGVVAVGTKAVMAVQNLPANVMLTYSMVLEPISIPGRDTGGVTLKIDIERQIDDLKRIFPNRTRIGTLYNPVYSGADVAKARQYAERLGLSLDAYAIETGKEAAQVIPKFSRQTFDLLWIMADKTVSHPQVVSWMIDRALLENLPLVGLSIYHVKAGALAAFSADFSDIGAQTAEYIQKHLQARKPLQIESPRKIVIFVNAAVEKRLGLENTFSVFPEVVYYNGK